MDSGYAAGYQYDAATGRLERVTGPGLPSGTSGDNGAWYEYLKDGSSNNISDLVQYVRIHDDNDVVKTQTTRTYEDHRDLLTEVKNEVLNTAQPPVLTVLSDYQYGYDDLGRREWMWRTGSFTFIGYDWYTYNARNELTDSDFYGSVNPPPGGSLYYPQYDYRHDPIGKG